MKLEDKVTDAKRTGGRMDDLSPLQKAALAIKELRSRITGMENAQREPIAIVGMGCRFPQADGLDAYWRLLSEGRDAIGEVPPDRWDLEQYFDINPNAPGKISTRYGGFLNHVDQFDASFFGISPGEAERLDPQHRLLLEVAWHALEDAGQSPAALRGTRTGVFVGITQTDYGVMQLGGDADNIHAYTGTGNGLCFAAGRLAYVLGVHGPTFSVDTACSSSMVALHQAVTALRNRECDVALVAGAQLNLTPPMQIFLSKTQSFAPDGRCRTFDEAANGFVLGEGVGVLVLRRLSDATARSDQIRAVIRGSGINHDGPASGLTVPSEGAQEALLRWVYERAGLTPADIDYVEAHGTATQIGDPIEVSALRAVFGLRAEEDALMLGSVKTNFGHLNAAAGVAGLIKVVLMLQHEQIAPNLHFKQPSSRVPWDGFTVKVPTALTGWPRGEKVRRAGVSSFGLSGTNTHTVIEEAPLAKLVVADADADNVERPQHLLCLSARSEPALRELAQAYADSQALRDETRLADVCFSAATGRSHFAWRLAILADSSAQLRDELARYARSGDGAAAVPKGGIGRIALLFASDVVVADVRTLALTQPRVAATLARCATSYAESGASADLFASGDEHPAAQFACQFALSDLWQDWGIQPAAVAGSGIGALTALCVAGVFDLTQAFAVMAGQTIDGRAPELPVYSGVDGSLLPFAPVTGYCLKTRTDAGVSTAIKAWADAGMQTVLAIGGQSSSDLQSAQGDLIGLPTASGSLWPMLLTTLATLYRRGAAIEWTRYDAGFIRNRLRLPGYQFQRKRFWLEGLKPVAAVSCAIAPMMSAPIANVEAAPVAVAPAAKPIAGATDWSRLLGSQLQAASASINDVVAQQLQFLRSRMTVAAPVPQRADSAEEKVIARETPTPPTAAVVKAEALDGTLGDWHVLMVAADDEAALENLTGTLAADASTRFTGVIGTGSQRRMLVHRGDDDARLALGTGGAPRDLKRVIAAVAKAERSVVFMFPGVGDHYLRMGQGLHASEPVFRATVDRCCDFVKSSLGIDLLSVLYPPSAAIAPSDAVPKKPDMRAMLGRSATTDPAEVRLNQTIHSQTLVFIIEYALGQMWLARGVVPQAMIGYSIGEYAAACLSGVIDVDDALMLITRRAQLIEALPHGVMLAVPLSEARVLPMLGTELSLSIVSTPTLCVVGGPEAAIAELEQRLRSADVVSRRLPGTHAFHSRMLAPIHDALIELVQGFRLQPPRIPYVSNLTGDWITDAQACDPAYWARHTWQTVRFADGLACLLDTENRVFLEVGPGLALGSFVLQHPTATQVHDKIVLSSLKNRYEQQADEASFLTTLGKLWLSGVTFTTNN